ncbi:MAG: gamma-glutamyltransferase [Nitriliruptoraceae bacterium]
MPGMVVCPQPRAADVGAEILASGGSAFDAAVATAFAQMIADPFMCGIGGFGSIQAYSANTGEITSLDFHTTGGSGIVEGMWAADVKGRTEVSGYTLFDDFRSELGYTAIMTPGTVAGFGAFHNRFGSRPWAELLQPAIAMANDGVTVTPFFAEYLARPLVPGLPGGMQRVSATDACRSIYVKPDGSLYAVGDTLRNPDYGATLAQIAAEGPETFYTGPLSERLAADLEANGSYVTRDDLAGYKPIWQKPVTGTYRGYTLSSVPPPASGVTLIQILQILDHFPLATMAHGSAEHLDLVARAMAAAHHDRELWLADPHFTDVPVDDMVSRERAAFWAEKIASGELPPGAKATEPSATTQLCIADEAGNVVSCTHSLGTGSGAVTPGAGFVYNNSMKLFDPFPGGKNAMMPGKARVTGMVPTLILKDGVPVMSAGAPGGSVIISAVAQSISNVIDFGMSPAEAVAAPRIHCESGPIEAEARMPDRVKRELESLGHTVRRSARSYDMMMSYAHLLELDPVMRGGADPRSGGGVAWA